MGMTDNLKARAGVGAERVVNAWGALRGTQAQPAAAPAEPTVQRGYPGVKPADPARAAAMFEVADARRNLMGEQQVRDHVNNTMDRKAPGWMDRSNQALERVQGAQQRVATTSANLSATPLTPQPPAPAAPAPAAAPSRLARIAGPAAGVLTAGVEGVSTARDVMTPGMTGLDQTARVAEGVGRTAGAIAGGALGASAGSVVPVVGTAIGGIAGGALGYAAPDLVNKAVNYFTGGDTKLASETAAGLRRAGATTAAPTVAPAPVAPAVQAAPAAPAVLPPVEDFEANTPQARGIRAQVADNKFVPTEGNGLFVNNSTGKAYRINAQPKPAEEAKPQQSDRDALVAGLRNEMATAGNGRARRDAMGRLAAVLDNEAQRDVARKNSERESAKFNAELGDKRMKDFNEQHVNNQFYTKDKDGKAAPDVVKNARFLDYMRQADPRFATEGGLAQIYQLSPQDRNKLVAEMRQSFEEKETVEQASNDSALFRKPGYSNAPVTLRGKPREAVAGDIPDIGIRKYLWSNLPFTNTDVVDTDRGTILAEDYVGDGEDSRTRRSKLYPGQK